MEFLGTLGKINTTKLDELAVVDVEDIHVLLTCRGRHIGHHTCILDTHLGTLQSIAPSHGFGLYTLVGVQPTELFHGLLVEPVGHLLDGAILIVSNLGSRNAATLMMDEGVEVHQVVVLTKYIRVTLEVADARVVTTIAKGGAHDVVLPFPRTCRRVAHGITQSLRTTGRGIGYIVVAIALIEPRSLLIMLDMRKFCNFTLQ